MSFITGKPFVDSILGGLKEIEILRLQTLINNQNPELQGSYRTYPLGSLPADSLENIIKVINTGSFKYVSISYDPVVRDYHKGILCRLGGGNFSFLGWEPGTKVMSAVKLTQNNFSPVNEQLTTEEFRRVLSDLVIESGEVGDFVKIEEVTNLPLEGEEDTIYLSDTNVIADGVVELPVPEVSDEGKSLVVGNNSKYQLLDGKAILSQIEVVNLSTTSEIAYFPKGVIPMIVWDVSEGEWLYFNYTDGTLRLDDETDFQDYRIVVHPTDGRIGIQYNPTVIDDVLTSIEEIYYILGDTKFDYNIPVNALDVFLPQKLYNHQISYSYQGDNGLFSFCCTDWAGPFGSLASVVTYVERNLNKIIFCKGNNYIGIFTGITSASITNNDSVYSIYGAGIADADDSFYAGPLFDNTATFLSDTVTEL